MDIGIRELRDGLSRHLTSVREGHVVTVTDHGRPVARIVPVVEMTSLERLISEGRVTQATARKGGRPEPIVAAGPVSDLIDNQRK